MRKKWFTSDFHLGMRSILEFEKRPFSTIEEMNEKLISECEKLGENDVIVHLGDLACFGFDRHFFGSSQSDDEKTKSIGLSIKPEELFKNVKAEFVNVRGNHDVNNRVDCFAHSMQISLGRRFPQVVCGHYPSYDARSKNYVKFGWILLCGHVHGKWKHCLDLDRRCLNVNVGVDVWNYRLVSENELIEYLNFLISHKPDELRRCKTINGKLVFFDFDEKNEMNAESNV